MSKQETIENDKSGHIQLINQQPIQQNPITSQIRVMCMRQIHYHSTRGGKPYNSSEKIRFGIVALATVVLSGPEVDRSLRCRFGALLLIEHVEGLSAAEALGERVQSVVLVIAVCALHVPSVFGSGIYGGLKVSALQITGQKRSV